MARLVQLTLIGFEHKREHRHRFFPEDVPTYEWLETQALIHYSRIFPSEEWNVHFHLSWEDADDNECPAPLQIVLWNAGTYLETEKPQDGIVKIAAHFVPKKGDRSMEFQIGLGIANRSQLGDTSLAAILPGEQRREATITGTPDTNVDSDRRQDLT